MESDTLHINTMVCQLAITSTSSPWLVQLLECEGSSSILVLLSMLLNITATFLRKDWEPIADALRSALMLRIWLADHDRVSSCRGLFDLPRATELPARGVSNRLEVAHVMLLLDDMEPP